jgi:hypothetical protein
MHKNFYEINEYLGEILQAGKPASVIRLDNTAGYVIDCLVKGSPIHGQFLNPNTILEGGVYPNTPQYMVDFPYRLSFEAMHRADVVGFVDISGDIRKSPLASIFANKVLFFSDGYMVMDPGSLLGYSKLYIENLTHPETFTPWTRYLKGKRVLVVSTHAESIKHQWKNREQIWGKHLQDIAPFDLVDVIRSPYHPAIDDRQYPNCPTWLDSVNHIKALMDKYEYDVLLSGASTSSPLLVDHAKLRGKVGIQTGGVIQLYFGIKGGRWAKVSGYSEWHNMFNDHWIYPLKIDEAQKRTDVQGLESSFAYWG